MSIFMRENILLRALICRYSLKITPKISISRILCVPLSVVKLNTNEKVPDRIARSRQES